MIDLLLALGQLAATQPLGVPANCQIAALASPPPSYSKRALYLGAQGRVSFRFLVTPEGRVTEVQVVGRPNAELAKAAVAGIRAWRFTPHTCGDAKGLWLSSWADFKLSANNSSKPTPLRGAA